MRDGAIGPWWIRGVARALNLQRPAGFATVVSLLAGTFGLCNSVLFPVLAWSRNGEQTRVILSGAAAILVTGGFYLLIWVARWPLLFAAVRSAVATALPSSWFDEHTVLVGIGGGGCIAAGLVAKSLLMLGSRSVPTILAFDVDYIGDDATPRVSAWLSPGIAFSQATKPVLIAGWVGSGESVRLVRERLGLSTDCRCFALVVSGEQRDPCIRHYLVEGAHGLLPWPKATRLDERRLPKGPN